MREPLGSREGVIERLRRLEAGICLQGSNSWLGSLHSGTFALEVIVRISRRGRRACESLLRSVRKRYWEGVLFSLRASWYLIRALATSKTAPERAGQYGVGRQSRHTTKSKCSNLMWQKWTRLSSRVLASVLEPYLMMSLIVVSDCARRIWTSTGPPTNLYFFLA